MQRGNQTKIKAFQNPFIMSKIQMAAYVLFVLKMMY